MRPFPTEFLVICALIALLTLFFKHERRIYVWLLALFGLGLLLLQQGINRFISGDYALRGFSKPHAWYQDIPAGLFFMLWALYSAITVKPNTRIKEPSKWLNRIKLMFKTERKRYRPPY
jgi:hypothetical protein